MKTRRITIIAAIAALVFVGTSCGNKTQKTSQEEVTTVEQSANSGALEIDNLLADAESLAGQEVTVEGVCTHICKHGGRKIFVMIHKRFVLKAVVSVSLTRNALIRLFVSPEH